MLDVDGWRKAQVDVDVDVVVGCCGDAMLM
jgi:hypothetical protein